MKAGLRTCCPLSMVVNRRKDFGMTPYIYNAYIFQLYSQTTGQKKNEIAACISNVWGYKEILPNGISVANVRH